MAERVGIIGGGSVGLLLAGYLHKAGYSVTVYTRTVEQAQRLAEKGLTLYNEQGKAMYRINSRPLSIINQLNDDYLFLAVKQYDLQKLSEQLLQQVGRVNSIFLMQNGMGHLRYLDQFTAMTEHVFVAIVEHGALKQSDTEVAHTGNGEMKLGNYLQKERQPLELCRRLTKAGFLTAAYENWLALLEKKLVVNGVINPLTALFNVPNGGLVENRYYLQLMRKLYDEIALVLPCGEEGWQQIISICQKTAKNRSSMLRDIDAGRRTEIEAITGVILELAKKGQHKLALNEFIYNCIKGIQLQRKEDDK